MLAVAAVAAPLYFTALDSPFYSRREAREALVVREEVVAGEWILPLRNGREVPSKPPLFHWLAGLVSIATGSVDELSVRFPSALLATLTLLLVGRSAERKWGAPAAVSTALVLGTSIEWIRAATSARVDMTLTAFLTLVFLSLERALEASPPGPGVSVALYGGVALATLAKGPVAFVLPVLVGLVTLALRRDLGRIRHLHLVPGTVIALGLPTAWYVLAALRGGEAFVTKHLWTENVARFLAAESYGLPHVHPLTWYVPQFLEGFLPWSVLLVAAVAALLRRRRLDEERLLYPLVWFSVVFVFFSLARGKRDVYLLPLYPAAALVVGRWAGLVLAGEEPVPRWLRAVFVVAGGAAVVAFVLGAAVLVGEKLGGGTLDSLAPLLDRGAAARLDVIREATAGSFGATLVLVIAATVAAFSALLGAWSGRWRIALGGFAAVPVLLGTFLLGIYEPALAARRTYKPFLDEVRNTVGPEDELVFFRAVDYPALFYAGRNVPSRRDPFVGGSAAGKRRFVLLGERAWEALPQATRDCAEVVSRSRGTGYRGRERLVLAVRRGCQTSTASADRATGIRDAAS